MELVSQTHTKLCTRDRFWEKIEEQCTETHGMNRTKEYLTSKWETIARDYQLWISSKKLRLGVILQWKCGSRIIEILYPSPFLSRCEHNSNPMSFSISTLPTFWKSIQNLLRLKGKYITKQEQVNI